MAYEHIAPQHVKTRVFEIGDIKIGGDEPFVLIAGPCQIEGMDHALMMAERIAKACESTGTRFIYKSSYDKANRSSIGTSRGIGMEEGLNILQAVKDQFGCPVLTDVHETTHVDEVKDVIDVIQIPAFLCRQTDLLFAAGQTGRPINIKKGQFLAPEDMKNVASKIASTGNEKILLCERGVSFGYHALVTDMRSFPIMAETGYPVVYDVTHSVQQPGAGGQGGEKAGGQRQFVPHLARAAVAVGIATLFIEIYPDPDKAPCDGPSATPLKDLPKLIETLLAIDKLAKNLNA